MLLTSHGALLTFQTLGKTGRVLKVYGDGDLRVAVGNQTWTFNPLCVTPVPPHVITDLNNTMGHNERQDLQSKHYKLVQFWEKIMIL